MGSISGLLGTAGGQSGTGIAGPNSASILNPATTQQANDQYTNANNALAQQQAFLQATQAQNGLANQSSVFNQLQGVANGTGPNPAQAMLAQSTGANTANQAALMAGQRGSGANAGLIARQAAQQGGANQQNAAGQAATMQANQSLNALGQLGSLAGQQVSQQAAATGANTGASQAEQGQILGAIQGQNNANVQNQSSINNANAGLAGQTMTGQQNMIGNIAGGVGAAFGLAEGGKVPHYDQGTLNVQPIAQPTIPTLSQATQPATTGPKSSFAQAMQGKTGTGSAGTTIGYGLGKGLQSLFGSSTPATPTNNGLGMGGGNAANGDYSQLRPDSGAADGNYAALTPDAPTGVSGADMSEATDAGFAKGGKVPALVSPGEKYLSPKDVKEVKAKGKNPMEVGETIPGKAKVKGAKNSYANDTVPKTLEEGGIVLPRSVTKAKHPAWEAHKFVSALMANGGLVKPTLKKSK